MTAQQPTTKIDTDYPQLPATAADGRTKLFNCTGYALMVQAVDFNRLYAESEMRRVALLDEMKKTTQLEAEIKAMREASTHTKSAPTPYCEAAGEYPPMPEPKYSRIVDGFPCITIYEHQHWMRVYVDADRAMRAQAAPAAVAVPSREADSAWMMG